MWGNQLMSSWAHISSGVRGRYPHSWLAIGVWGPVQCRPVGIILQHGIFLLGKAIFWAKVRISQHKHDLNLNILKKPLPLVQRHQEQVSSMPFTNLFHLLFTPGKHSYINSAWDRWWYRAVPKTPTQGSTVLSVGTISGGLWVDDILAHTKGIQLLKGLSGSKKACLDISCSVRMSYRGYKKLSCYILVRGGGMEIFAYFETCQDVRSHWEFGPCCFLENDIGRCCTYICLSLQDQAWGQLKVATISFQPPNTFSSFSVQPTFSLGFIPSRCYMFPLSSPLLLAYIASQLKYF